MTPSGWPSARTSPLSLAISHAHANRVDDCNQSADAEKQIECCTKFLQQDPYGSNAALAYGLRGEAQGQG